MPVQLTRLPRGAQNHHGLQLTRLPCLSLISWNLLKLMSIESMMPSSHLILCRTVLLPPIPPASGSFPVSELFEIGRAHV